MDEKVQKSKLREWLLDVLRGFAIGVAFIIPGFSGGSIAAILGIYEKMIGAIADIFKAFKKSILTLLPIGTGMVIGVLALLFPLGLALEKFPIPTVSLFVGLALGGLPSIYEKIKTKPRPHHAASFLIPLICAAALSFLPVASDVDLLNLNPMGYVLLVLVGFIGSVALVIPGISGSMLLLIFGYYNPVVRLATEHLLKGKDVLAALPVFLCLALGIALGFFAISKFMKWLLASYPDGTYFAILGFILGSVPAIYLSCAKEAGITLATLPSSAWYWIVSAVLLLVGVALSVLVWIFAKRTVKKEN